jgi:hypothetical protein
MYNINCYLFAYLFICEVCGSVVVKALHYRPEGNGLETR